MSGFDNPSNRGRVERMIEALGHIEKSARSNKAKPEEILAMLEPLRTRIADLCYVAEPAADAERLPATEEGQASAPMTPERRATAITHSKIDRAVRSCEKMVEELRELRRATP